MQSSTFSTGWLQSRNPFKPPPHLKDDITNTNLEYGGLVVFLEVVGKDVGVHERTPTLAQDVQALLQELDLCTQITFVKAILCIKKAAI
jgi:hypothetical protein